MKKILAVILAAVMLLSFAACGGEAAGKVNLEELLVAEKWINIYNRYNTLQFDIGNYGEEIYFGNSSTSFEWKTIDNETVTKTTHFFGENQDIKHILTEFQGVKALYNPAEKVYYVQESVYDGIRENLVFPTHIAVATVDTKDGNTKIMTAEEIEYIEATNSTKYRNLYYEAKVTLVGEVSHIGITSIRVGGYDWLVEDLDSYDLSIFETGDIIIATGILESGFSEKFSLVDNTTIKHYEG